MGYDVPMIAGTQQQEKEYYTNKILEYFPSRNDDPALLYGDPKLEWLRLVNDGIVPSSVKPTDNLLTDFSVFRDYETGAHRHPNADITYRFKSLASFRFGSPGTGWIPYDARRTYVLSFDVKASIAGTMTFFSMDFSDLNRQNIDNGAGKYPVNRKVVSTSWENITVVIDPKSYDNVPSNTAFIRPTLFVNHQNGVQGGTQYFANFRLIDVTDKKTNVFFDVHANTAQDAVGVNVWTAVNFQSIAWDTHKAWNQETNNIFTAPEYGSYLVTSSVSFPNTAVGTVIRLVLYKNGALWNSLDRVVKNDAGIAQLFGSCSVLLAKGDTLQIYVQSSVATPITSGRSNTCLQIAQIG